MEQKNSGLAIASMVCGIVGLVLSCCVPYLPLVLSIVGLVLGVISLRKQADGKGMAIAGVVCSIITLIPAILMLVMGASVMSALSAASM